MYSEDAMTDTPFGKTMDQLLTRLSAAVQKRNEAETEIKDVGDALESLIKLCEDDAAKAAYSERLQELLIKPGFTEVVRSILRIEKAGMTPVGIKRWITIKGAMNLASYSNPLASIHTTLRRMKEAGEIEEIETESGEKAFRLRSLKLNFLTAAQKVRKRTLEGSPQALGRIEPPPGKKI
jgi:hypothetical protein